MTRVFLTIRLFAQAAGGSVSSHTAGSHQDPMADSARQQATGAEAPPPRKLEA